MTVEIPGVATLRRERLELPAGSVQVGDRLILPTSGRDFPVWKITEHDDGTIAIHWRELDGDPEGPAASAWRKGEWPPSRTLAGDTRAGTELGGTFHRRPDETVVVLR